MIRGWRVGAWVEMRRGEERQRGGLGGAKRWAEKRMERVERR
jgi:hypothetical protein